MAAPNTTSKVKKFERLENSVKNLSVQQIFGAYDNPVYPMSAEYDYSHYMLPFADDWVMVKNPDFVGVFYPTIQLFLRTNRFRPFVKFLFIRQWVTEIWMLNRLKYFYPGWTNTYKFSWVINGAVTNMPYPLLEEGGDDGGDPHQ